MSTRDRNTLRRPGGSFAGIARDVVLREGTHNVIDLFETLKRHVLRCRRERLTRLVTEHEAGQ